MQWNGVSEATKTHGPCSMLLALLGHELMSVEGWRIGSFSRCINTASFFFKCFQVARKDVGFQRWMGEMGTPLETGTWDEVRMRSRAAGHPTEVSWHLRSFVFSSVLTLLQDMLKRERHGQVTMIGFRESGKCSMCVELKRMI